MTAKASALAFAVSMLTASAAKAVLVDFSTSEAVSFANCIAGTTGCDSTSPVLHIYGGYPGAAISTASAMVPGYGTVNGTVSLLSGTIGAPILAAFASSETGTRQNTTSVALQRYTYTGTVPTTRTFGGTLTYLQNLTGNYGTTGDGVLAGIDVFTLPGSTVDVGITPQDNFGALIFPSAFPGYFDLGSQEYSDATSTLAGTGMVDVTVPLNPGEMVWVWAFLQTPAPNGSTVDASHTFITGWDNTANLTPAVAVPEPATLALLALGLAGLGFSRRKLN